MVQRLGAQPPPDATFLIPTPLGWGPSTLSLPLSPPAHHPAQLPSFPSEPVFCFLNRINRRDMRAPSTVLGIQQARMQGGCLPGPFPWAPAQKVDSISSDFSWGAQFR